MFRSLISASSSLLIVVFISLTMSASLKAQDQTLGLFTYDTSTSEGYILFAPINSTTTYLLDNYGREVHSWESNYNPGLSVYLLENGNILRCAREVYGAGSGGRVQIIDWDGNVVWDFLYYNDSVLQHHDVEPLPNGNVLILAWETKTKEEAILAGRDPDLLSEDELWPEHIIEVEPSGLTGGNIVWEWHLWDHIIQDFDSTKENYGVVADHPELVDINYIRTDGHDWIHANAVQYNADLDQIVISSRSLSEFWIIDHSTTTAEAAGHSGGNNGKGGDILYRWGNPLAYRAGTEEDQMLFQQHDAHWIKPGLPGEGHILVFNNGTDRGFSTVDEIETPVDAFGRYPQPLPGNPYGPTEQYWLYIGDPPEDFFATFISGAQRQPNGNTLICSGPRAKFFEVTPEGQIVWEYISPITADGPLTQGDDVVGNLVFRCNRYPSDYPGLQGHELIPTGPLEIYPINITGTSHNPSAPTTTDSVIVTSTIFNDNVITSALLYVDTGNGFFSVAMYDDGNHHDDLASDNLYGVVIPPVSESVLVSYYVYAEDDTGAVTNDPPNPPSTVYRYRVGYRQPVIYVNEFMALNNSCCPDEYGDYDSWLELYNAESYDVNLAGMYLTNDYTYKTQFQLGDITIPAKGYMIFWADREIGEGKTHTNFIFKHSYGEIGFYNSDRHGNTLIDTISFINQSYNISMGRLPDGSIFWSKFGVPTPGTTNGVLICGDIDGDTEGPDVADLSFLVAYLYQGGPPPPTLAAANVDGIIGPGGPVDVADLSYLVVYLFQGGPPPACE